MNREHHYTGTLRWTGHTMSPTTSYAAYSREWEISFAGKPPMRGTADPSFRGDASLYNPEELLLAALSSCHLLTYLALAARKGLAVVDYEDAPTGTMVVEHVGGRFVDVLLKPRVTLAPGSDVALAESLHGPAHDGCFIASSVNFPVRHEATIIVGAESTR